MSPLDPAPQITRVRLGLATNSSSSHSLVLLLAPEAEDELERGRYHWEEFTLVTREARRHYLAAMLVSNAEHLYAITADDLRRLREHHADDALRGRWEAVAAEIRARCGLPAETDLRFHEVDHQSVHPFARAENGRGPDDADFARYRDLVLAEDVAVLGGADVQPHPLADEDRHVLLGGTDGPFLHLRGEG